MCLIVALLFLWLAYNNPQRVDLTLRPGYAWSGPLWLWMTGAFLLGVGPTLLWHQFARWLWGRRLHKAHAKIEAAQTKSPERTADSEEELLARARIAGGMSGYREDTAPAARPAGSPPGAA